MDVSVVIPCYNEQEVISDQLEALTRQSWHGDWEVIVADNGSEDRTREVVESFRGRIPGLRIVDASDVKGASHARNVGVREAHADRILFCDADDVVADNYVSAMARALESHDFIACRLEETLLNDPWQVTSWQNGQKNGLLSGSRFLPAAGGGTMGMKRWVFERVGGFDAGLRVREDTDLAWRIQLTGVSLEFVPETEIHYRYPTGYRRMFRQSLALAEGQVRLYKRYRRHGMPRLPFRKALLGRGRWLGLARGFGSWYRHGPAERARLVRALGHKIGRLRGSLRYRTLAL